MWPMGPVPMRKGQTQYRQPTRSRKEEDHRIEVIAKNDHVGQDEVDEVSQMPGSRMRKGP